MKLNEVVQTDLEKLLTEYNITDYSIRNDGLVDVNGHVELNYKNFTKLPINFGHVAGNFSCAYCHNLQSLEGVPTSIDGNFSCYNCDKIKSLDYLPKQITGMIFLGLTSKVKDVLKIFNIKGIKYLYFDDTRKLKKLEKIINKYLPKRDMLNCQDELIEAGFEEYAEVE